MLRDSYGRQIKDLRISLTDHCNFRCSYCKSTDPTGSGPAAWPGARLAERPDARYDEGPEAMSLDDFYRLARIFVRLGIQKVRLTGGEPLLRPGLEDFISRLSAVPGLNDLALTTNAWLLAEKAEALASAGLTRLNISMDSVDRGKFARITGADAYGRVIAGIEASQRAGFHPVKVNVVLVRDLNDDEIVDFARFGRERGVVVRFIEFMPLDADHNWSREQVVTAAEVLEKIRAVYPLVEVERDNPSSTALRYRYADGAGEIGLVAPVSLPFCGACSRIRLTCDGKIRTCLFSLSDNDVKHLLRNGASDDKVAAFIEQVASRKEERHRINDPDFVQPRQSMLFIGG
jgi:cyclic pyranopterin phosphate synthase